MFVSYGRELIPVIAAVLARMMRKRLVLQTHGMLEKRRTWPHRLADAVVVRQTYISADERIALTNREAQRLVTYCRDRRVTVRVLGNPVLAQVDSVVPKSPGGSEVLFLGRLYHRKGVHDLAERLKWP